MYRITTFENGERRPRFQKLNREQAIRFFQWLMRTNPEVDPWLETETEVGLPPKAQQAISGSFEEYVASLSAAELRKLAVAQHLQIIEARVSGREPKPPLVGDLNVSPMLDGSYRFDLSAYLSQEILIDFLGALSESFKEIAP